MKLIHHFREYQIIIVQFKLLMSATVFFNDLDFQNLVFEQGELIQKEHALLF